MRSPPICHRQAHGGAVPAGQPCAVAVPPPNPVRARLLQLLQSIPYSILVPVAILMALAPVYPKPHLLEKLQMLLAGDLKRPIDIFDLLMHGAPLALLALKMALSR